MSKLSQYKILITIPEKMREELQVLKVRGYSIAAFARVAIQEKLDSVKMLYERK